MNSAVVTAAAAAVLSQFMSPSSSSSSSSCSGAPSFSGFSTHAGTLLQHHRYGRYTAFAPSIKTDDVTDDVARTAYRPPPVFSASASRIPTP